MPAQQASCNSLMAVRSFRPKTAVARLDFKNAMNGFGTRDK
jgi:hypothetical protein